MARGRFVGIWIAVSLVHYVAQGFVWSLADAIPGSVSEKTKALAVVGTEILFTPLVHLTSIIESVIEFDAFPVLVLLNSVLWGWVVAALTNRIVNCR